MAEVSPEELGRLLVPLTALRGFDEVYGLEIYGLGMCLDQDAETIRTWSHNQAVRHQRDMCEIDLADAATADRIARWVAGRVGFEHAATAPNWGTSGSDHPVHGPSRYAYLGDSDHHFDLPDDFDDTDDRRLPDGSMYADRLALALVAQHLGATP